MSNNYVEMARENLRGEADYDWRELARGLIGVIEDNQLAARRYAWLRDAANETGDTGPLVFMTDDCGKPTGKMWDAILFGERLDFEVDAALTPKEQGNG